MEDIDDIESGIANPEDIGRFLPRGDSGETAIPTGVVALDKRLGGGARPGQLHLVCAYTGHGKSSFAVHLTRVAASFGHPCSILFHQMTREEYLKRLAAWESGEPYRDHPMVPVPDLVRLTDLRDEHNPDTSGLETHIAEIGEDPAPVLIVDSIDSLFSRGDQLEGCCDDLAGIAEKTGAAIWATTQANDLGSDTSTVTLRCLRNSQGKAFAASLVLGLGRTAEDDKKGIVTFTADKNRHGEKFQVRACADFAAQRFSDADDTYEPLRMAIEPE